MKKKALLTRVLYNRSFESRELEISQRMTSLPVIPEQARFKRGLVTRYIFKPKASDETGASGWILWASSHIEIH
jgi:S-adenosylmethionine/arginine decarboxylase-like enzyme